MRIGRWLSDDLEAVHPEPQGERLAMQCVSRVAEGVGTVASRSTNLADQPARGAFPLGTRRSRSASRDDQLVIRRIRDCHPHGIDAKCEFERHRYEKSNVGALAAELILSQRP
jgi:hypothetical protein